MTHETFDTKDWARRERETDRYWIKENLDTLWGVAAPSFGETGRGAIYVDTSAQRLPRAGDPFAYLPQNQAQELYNEDTRRMVAEYDPAHELVLVLLKTDERTSAYRVRVIQRGREEAMSTAPSSERAPQPAGEPTLEPPDIETLIGWEAQGGCEAACPHGCWVEPDGMCPHGNPSWLLKLGLI